MIFIGSTTLAANLQEEELDTEPSREWVSTTVEKLGLVLETPLEIVEDRFNNASKNLLKQFMEQHQEIIENCPLPLLFGADETMFKSILKGKVVTLKEHFNLLRQEPSIPHITAMCTHSVTGAKPPPFIILPQSIQNLPPELDDISNSGMAWFASSKSGWMTRDLFLIYIIHFINWLTMYRKTLPEGIRNARGLLIVDGHGSRECPIALMILPVFKMDLLILPAHTTHITQMFDVCLASPLKKKYSQLLRKLLEKVSLDGQENGSKIAVLRKAAITAFVSAWTSVATFESCMNAARSVGYYPFDSLKVTTSRYAVERTEQEDQAYLEARRNRTRMDINAQVITTEAKIREIADKVRGVPSLAHLAQYPLAGERWINFVQRVCKKQLPNKCFFIGRLPPYVSNNGNVICFD